MPKGNELLLDMHVISSFPFGIIRTSFTRSMCISSDRLFSHSYSTKYAVLSLTHYFLISILMQQNMQFFP